VTAIAQAHHGELRLDNDPAVEGSSTAAGERF
jgi:hypothetical protein